MKRTNLTKDMRKRDDKKQKLDRCKINWRKKVRTNNIQAYFFVFLQSNFGADMDLTASKLGCKHAGQSTLTR